MTPSERAKFVDAMTGLEAHRFEGAKTMTPEERAEHISWKVLAFIEASDKIVARLDIKDYVASEIRQAAEEAHRADCVKCKRALGKWCEECAIHEANANYRMGKAEAYEQAAKVLEGDVLLTPDEFEGKTKLKVFDLLERLASTIRALKETK